MSEDAIDRDDLTASLDPVDRALDGSSPRARHASDEGDPAGGTGDHRARNDAGTDGDGHRDTQCGDNAQPSDTRDEALERRVSELEAELDSIRGLLDGVEAIETAVERRASTALAKVEALERRIDSADDVLVRERLPADRNGEQRTGSGGDPKTNAGSDRLDLSDHPSQSDSAGSCRDGRRSRTDAEHRSHKRESETRHTSQTSEQTSAVSDGDAGLRDDGSASGSEDTLASRLRDAFR